MPLPSLFVMFMPAERRRRVYWSARCRRRSCSGWCRRAVPLCRCPSPVTFSPPLEPVLLSTMPLLRAVRRDALERHVAGADRRVGDVERGAGARADGVAGAAAPSPCRRRAPVALKPVPDVVVMSRPLPPAWVEIDRRAGVAGQVDRGVGAGGQRLGLTGEIDGAAGVGC